MIPRDAFFAAAEQAKPREAVGRVSAELVTPYRPGVPAVAPGEVYNEPIVDYLEEIVAKGAFSEGAADQKRGLEFNPALHRPALGLMGVCGSKQRITDLKGVAVVLRLRAARRCGGSVSRVGSAYPRQAGCVYGSPRYRDRRMRW